MKAGGQRGIWVEVWANRGRPEPFPPSTDDVVIAIIRLQDKLIREFRPFLETVSIGGGQFTRRWVGFVPESAVEEFREVLKQHGITLEVEES